MKRYPVVIGVTAAGLAGVLSFHSHSGSVALPARAATSSGNSPATRASQTKPPAKGTSRKTTPTAGPSSQSASSQSASSQSGSSQSLSTKSATGRLEQYGYGQLSVRVTMSGGKITHLSVASLQTADTYSQQLAAQVIPILQREVLSAQSARINGLSGATYTSEAYAYSVQSALDKLRK
ncbi:MAG: FMN-binding protein [Actinomycetota bacterium]|nr:FMN-binding protein [Actinomycetota bacterium]